MVIVLLDVDNDKILFGWQSDHQTVSQLSQAEDLEYLLLFPTDVVETFVFKTKPSRDL
jgi:hypothetical protein